MNSIKRVIDFCKRAFSSNNQPTSQLQPQIYQRDQHPVSRKLISANAKKVLYRLNSAGFEAYLVGGGVRDILLGITPKDFDIATNATPEQIKQLFRNCRLIGRRFRLAHILFGRDIIEVATFRGHHDEKANEKTAKTSDHGMLLRDNIFGSIEEDAERRDFTINALYYNIQNFCIYDFSGGVADIQQGVIQLIGDPETRYREDPVRMLRAVRFSVKLNMQMSEATKAPIFELHELLRNIPPARMFEEFNKLFVSGQGAKTYQMLKQFNLFQYFFPAVEQLLKHSDEAEQLEQFLIQALVNSDNRIANQQRVTPAFLLAAFLWHPMKQYQAKLQAKSNLVEQDAFYEALNTILAEQQHSIAVPKRFQSVIKDIWQLQYRLSRREGKRAEKTLAHPKFRAGYDFLLLRAQTNEPNCDALAKWWTTYQSSSHHTQQQMIKSLANNGSKRRRNARRGFRGKKNSKEA